MKIEGFFLLMSIPLLDNYFFAMINISLFNDNIFMGLDFCTQSVPYLYFLLLWQYCTVFYL